MQLFSLLPYHGALKASNKLTCAATFVKVFVIVRKATFKGKWFSRNQYSVSVEVIGGGCGPASMFTSSTINDLDTVINESSLLLYKQVDHNNNVTDGPKLNISVHKSSGMATQFQSQQFKYLNRWLGSTTPHSNIDFHASI